MQSVRHSAPAVNGTGDARRRLLPGLAAGAAAITVNTLLLKAADWVHVDVGHGGLLKVLRPLCGPALVSLGIGRAWRSMHLPAVGTPGFKIGFHVAVGLLMALFYVFAFEPALPRKLSPLQKGLIYAALVWLANAAIVLPALGQGFVGTSALSAGGLAYYAFAHTVFFVLLAFIYAWLSSPVTSTA